ncbi:MAG: DUF3800 domain-containing protein [Ignavibacteriae bacterium]|nr:DUF3800 domain-containing protein [Ignavibacteriota bacterium]
MFISYFDESGDDGYPDYSSELFVLSSIYFHYSKWKQNYYSIQKFRQGLKITWDFPVKSEFHTKEFITDKNPYHGKYKPVERKNILFDFCNFISTLDFKIISVVIDKTKIRRPKYEVLKNALTYNIQRIENDLNLPEHDGQFLIITDEGRIKMMRSTTRSIQRINYIPSQIYPEPYRKEIERLIEDPLPKSSDESYFIQIVDMISFLVSLFAKQNLCEPKQGWAKRVLDVLSYGDDLKLLDVLKHRFNPRASKSPFGIVYYPK